MKIEFNIKLSAKNLYLFNMYQAYKGLQGILSLVLPIMIFVYTGLQWGEASVGSCILNIVIAILFLLYIPVTLWLRANKVVKNDPVLSKALHFEFSEENIRVSQGEENVEFEWDNVYRMMTFGGLLLIYTNRINAYVIEKKQMEDKYADLKALATSKLMKHRIKMK